MVFYCKNCNALIICSVNYLRKFREDNLTKKHPFGELTNTCDFMKNRKKGGIEIK